MIFNLPKEKPVDYLVLSRDQQRDLIRNQIGGFEQEHWATAVGLNTAKAQAEGDQRDSAVKSLETNLERLERNINACRDMLSKFDANAPQAE